MTEVLRYDEIDEEAYHRHPALSVSTAKRMLEPGGPARVRWELDHGRTERREYDVGHAAHKMVLGVGAQVVDVGPDLRTKAAREAADEARAAGNVPLRSGDLRTVLDMADALASSGAAELFTGGQPELSLFATDERTGLPIRGRLDYRRSDGLLIDYKTTKARGAGEDDFTRSVVNFGYHMQAAWYLDLAAACGLDGPLADRFIFVVQEKEAPYLVHVIELDDVFLSLGRTRNKAAIDMWMRCHETGIWPGYPYSGDLNDLTTLAAPPWAFTDDDEMEF